MDTVYLRGLQCECIIGVWEWERRVRQKLLLDIEMKTDIAAAGASDNLDDALNYQRVAERVTEVVAASEYALLESLIEDVANMVLQEFPVQSVKVRLDKGAAVSHVKNVGIEITRAR